MTIAVVRFIKAIKVQVEEAVAVVGVIIERDFEDLQQHEKKQFKEVTQ